MVIWQRPDHGVKTSGLTSIRVPEAVGVGIRRVGDLPSGGLVPFGERPGGEAGDLHVADGPGRRDGLLTFARPAGRGCSTGCVMRPTTARQGPPSASRVAASRPPRLGAAK